MHRLGTSCGCPAFLIAWGCLSRAGWIRGARHDGRPDPCCARPHDPRGPSRPCLHRTYAAGTFRPPAPIAPQSRRGYEAVQAGQITRSRRRCQAYRRPTKSLEGPLDAVELSPVSSRTRPRNRGYRLELGLYGGRQRDGQEPRRSAGRPAGRPCAASRPGRRPTRGIEHGGSAGRLSRVPDGDQAWDLGPGRGSRRRSLADV